MPVYGVKYTNDWGTTIVLSNVWKTHCRDHNKCRMCNMLSHYLVLWFFILRFDMTKPEKFYCEGELKRTLPNVRESCLKQEYSCERPPLVNISLANIVPDELHLMLRVTGNYKQWINPTNFSDVFIPWFWSMPATNTSSCHDCKSRIIRNIHNIKGTATNKIQ